MREKGWKERGPKAHSKNSDFGTPLIYVLFKWPSKTPPTPLPPAPTPRFFWEIPYCDFQETLPPSLWEGRGGGGTAWDLGSARGPFTVKKRPLLDENASETAREELNLKASLTICRAVWGISCQGPGHPQECRTLIQRLSGGGGKSLGKVLDG